MHKQISFYIDQFLSPYMCDYRKSFSTQHALLSLTEKWKKVLDNNGHGGAILMDLSKAFDTISHDLLIGKLHVYGFSKESFKLIRSYLTNRWQKTKLNTGFSKWTEILLGVPKWSAVGHFCLFYLLISGQNQESVWVNIDSCKFWKAVIKKFLESTLIAI